LTEPDLTRLKDALDRFHRFRTIFITTGVRPKGISLPRQHALVHYIALIRLFGAPNGLCTSLGESKHIRAVKEPWRRSNRNKPLGQMLVTNQRLDQLAAARADFVDRNMLTANNSTRRPSYLRFIDIANLSYAAGPVKRGASPPSRTFSQSVPDEDLLEEAVTDPDVLAEVKLPTKPSMSSFVVVYSFINQNQNTDGLSQRLLNSFSCLPFWL